MSTAHRYADRDTNSERNHSGCYYCGSAVSRSDVGIAVNHRGVVHGNVHHLRIRRLNHNSLRRLLDDNNLRA
jgi:hypothetical protein